MGKLAEMLEGIDLYAAYGSTPALRGVSIVGFAGQSIAILGPSGCGKSTLLHCLAGLHRPNKGRVALGRKDLYSLSEHERSALRLQRFGFVFQTSELVAELTVRENVALPLELLGASRRESVRAANVALDRLGIDDCAERRPANASGGQRQRAAIARALITKPSVVFADEPTGALDSENRDLVLDLLLEATREIGSLLILVTHDAQMADRLDRNVHMVDGRIHSDEVDSR